MHYLSELMGSRTRSLLFAAALACGLHANVAMAQNAVTDYLPIVGPGAQSFGFKDLNRPDLLPVGSVPNTLQVSYIAGSSSPDRLKFFLPPGSVMFTANFLTYLSPTEAKGVMRFKSPPTTQAFQVTRDMAFAPSNSGGGSFGGAFNEKILQNLLGGQEVFFYGDAGAGLMPISYGGALISPVPSEGGYAYGRFQYPGGVLGATQWTVFVDKNCYQNWYANATWDSSGNPSDTATHTCSGSSGGTTNPGGETTNPGTTLTGITLSVSSLSVGSSANSAIISPLPVTAILPTCSAVPSGWLLNDALESVKNPNTSVWKLSSAASTMTAPTTVTFDCGGKTAQLTVNPAGFDPTWSKQITEDPVSKNVNISLTLRRSTAEIQAGGAVDYWVAASVPANAFFSATDLWFFLAKEVSSNSLAWMPFTTLDFGAVAFSRSVVLTKETDQIDIPLGFKQADLKPFKVKVHFGYKSGSGDFRSLGVIWDTTQ